MVGYFPSSNFSTICRRRKQAHWWLKVWKEQNYFLHSDEFPVKRGWMVQVRFIANGNSERQFSVFGRISHCIMTYLVTQIIFWNQKNCANDIFVLELITSETMTTKYQNIRCFTTSQSPQRKHHSKAGCSTVCYFIKYTVDDTADWLGKERGALQFSSHVHSLGTQTTQTETPNSTPIFVVVGILFFHQPNKNSNSSL